MRQQESGKKRLANMDVNNAGFEIQKQNTLKMFYEELNAFNRFVRCQGYPPCILVRKP